MEQNSSLKDAHQSCEKALEAVVTKCNIASEHGTDGIDLAMANLRQTQELFVSALNNGKEYCSMRIQQNREHQVALQSKAVGSSTVIEHNSLFKDALRSCEEALQAVVAESNNPSKQRIQGIKKVVANLEQKHKLFISASKNATELCNMRIQQIMDQRAALQTKLVYLSTVPPIKLNYANRRYNFNQSLEVYRDLDFEVRQIGSWPTCQSSSQAWAELYEEVEHKKDLVDLDR